VVTIQILDRQGRPAPFANDAVKLDVGPVGKLIGMGNGDPTSHEPDKTDTRKAFSGLCMGIVQTRAGQTGRIAIQATAEGLEPAALLLTAEG
jgi:beta-galactosidase